MTIRSALKKCLDACLLAALCLITAWPTRAQSTSERYGTFNLGSYFVQNNEWGLENANGQGFSQTVWTTGAGSNAWSVAWNWPQGNDQLKSYPSIVRGWHYNKWSPERGGLPVQVSQNAPLNTTTTYNLSVSGNYDVAYDVFFGTAPDPGGPAGELMVWLQWSGQQPAGNRYASGVSLQGVPGTWDVWLGNVGWPVWSFTPTAQYGWNGDVSLNLQPFVWHCSYANSWLPQNWYVLNIEFGVEINKGSGTLNVTAFTASAGGVTPPSSSLPATLTLKALANNQYVCADNAGSSALIANRAAALGWETFDTLENGDGTYSFKARANGKIVCAENQGGSPLIANRTAVGDWEKFWVISNADGSVSLKAKANGQFVCADNGGSSPLIANRSAASTWESFWVNR